MPDDHIRYISGELEASAVEDLEFIVREAAVEHQVAGVWSARGDHHLVSDFKVWVAVEHILLVLRLVGGVSDAEMLVDISLLSLLVLLLWIEEVAVLVIVPCDRRLRGQISIGQISRHDGLQIFAFEIQNIFRTAVCALEAVLLRKKRQNMKVMIMCC